MPLVEYWDAQKAAHSEATMASTMAAQTERRWAAPKDHQIDGCDEGATLGTDDGCLDGDDDGDRDGNIEGWLVGNLLG